MREPSDHRPIVVGVDGSAAAVDAVRWAAREAELRQRRLHIVHAYRLPGVQYFPRSAQALEDLRDAVYRTGRQWLRQAVDAAGDVAPDVDVDTGLSWQPPTRALLDEATDAALLVVGSRGEGGFTRLLLGSTAVAVSSHARCPVAVVRQSPEPTPAAAWRPVLVGVDGSPTSEAAIVFALREASLRDAPLLAVHTWHHPGISSGRLGAESVLPDGRVVEKERELLAQRMAGWQQEYPDVDMLQVVNQDHPANGLLREAMASNAQLLVLGSRGLGGFTGLLLGSTSHAVLQHARCPVVIVRPERNATRGSQPSHSTVDVAPTS